MRLCFRRRPDEDPDIAARAWAVCPADATGPQMNPFVFCGGSTSDPNTAAAWQVPLVKALAEKNNDKVKLALIAMDIPISRQGVDAMEKIAAAWHRGRR